MDSSDNVKCRYYTNEISVKLKIPSIQIGMSLKNGTRAITCRTVIPGVTRCYECFKSFTPDQMRRDFYTEEQLLEMKKNNYPPPSIVASVVDVNTIAAGLAGDAIFRLITRKEIIPYIHFEVRSMKLRTFYGERDPECRVCSYVSPDERFSGALAKND